MGDPETWKVVRTGKAKHVVKNPTHTTNSFTALDEDPQRIYANTSYQEAIHCQREATTKQCEHVETSKGWMLRTFGRQEIPTQRDEVIPTNEQTQILVDKDKKENEGEVVRHEVMHTVCDATCVDTSTVASVNLCIASNFAEAIGDNSNALIALPLQEVDTIPITMVSPC